MAEKASANRGGGTTGWTSTQAYVLAVVCLLVGVAGGYFLRGSGAPQPQQPAAAPVATPPGGLPGMSAMAQPTPQQMKQMADTQAAPLL